MQVRGVDEADDRIDRTDVRLPPEEHVDGDHFVAGSRGQAVEAGKVDDLEPSAIGLHAAGLLFDRHPGIVSHVLVHADQGG